MTENSTEEVHKTCRKPNGKVFRSVPYQRKKLPHDQGWAWLVCFAAFVVHALIIGQQNSADVICSVLMDEFSSQRDETAWVTTIASSVMYVFAALATFFTERFGSRAAVIIGSLITAGGLVASSYSKTLQLLYATYGVAWGLGSSFGLFPTLVILMKYFKKRVALATAIALAGAAVGTLIFGPLIRVFTSNFGVSVTLRVLAGLQSLMFFSALTLRPLKRKKKSHNIKKCDCSSFNNKGFLIWIVSLGLFMMVYFVPFVYIVRLAKQSGVSTKNASLLKGYMFIGFLLGSVILGILCDFPQINRLKVCQMSLLTIAVLTSVVTIATRYAWISLLAFTLGIFNGCYEMLVPVITRDIVGIRKFGPAIGALYTLLSFPRMLGLPVAGWIVNESNSQILPFYVSSAVTILAAAIMFLLNWVEMEDHDKTDDVVEQSSESDVTPPHGEIDEDHVLSSWSVNSCEIMREQRCDYNKLAEDCYLENNEDRIFVQRVTVL